MEEATRVESIFRVYATINRGEMGALIDGKDARWRSRCIHKRMSVVLCEIILFLVLFMSYLVSTAYIPCGVLSPFTKHIPLPRCAHNSLIILVFRKTV